MVRRTTSVFVVALLAMVMLAACGTEQDSGEKATVTRVAEAYTPPPATEVPAETGAPTAEAGGVAPATEVDVEMVDIAFTQTELTIAANTDVTINLVNNGMAVHNFHIEGTDYATKDYNAGGSGQLVVNLAPGEYVYFCAIPGHREAGMVGKLIVTDGTAGGGAAAEPTAATGGSGETAALATEFDVEMVDIAFTQTELTIPANTDVTLKLVNNGAAQHNLHIEGTDFKSADLNGGESGEMVVNLPAGEYVYFCAVPGHREAGMVGKLIVVDGGAAAGASESGASTEVTAEASGDAATGGAEPVTELTISLVDIAFDPTEATIPADTDVTITLVNNGAAVHAFKIDALGISSKELAAGESETIVINVAAGEYEFHCPIPGHTEAGMVGKLIVVAGSASGGSDSSESGDTAALATEFDVEMVDIAFTQTELTIPANTDVTFKLVNNGAAQHNLHIEGTEFKSADFNGGESGEMVVNLPAGEYVFFCAVPGHREAGMVGKLIVK